MNQKEVRYSKTNLVRGIGSGRGILLVGSVILEKSRPTWDTSLAECDLFFFLLHDLQIGHFFVTGRNYVSMYKYHCFTLQCERVQDNFKYPQGV